MQIPFKETYYIIRSPSRSNEPVPTAPADNVTTRPINHHARSHKRSEPHITPKKSTSSSKYHRETEESISEPRAPPTAPPVPPRKHRNDIPQKASPLAVLNNRQSQPSDSRHNGQHRSGWNEPDRSHTRANRSPREAVSNPHGDPIPLSTYHQTVLHSVPKNHHSAEVHGRHRSHRSSKHAVPVCPIRSYPDSIPIYENNRLRHVTQRKSESHVHSGPDSTKPNLPAQTNKKDPTSPIKSNRSTVISPNVLATPLKITPRATGSSSHSSSRRKRCAVDPEAILVVENAPSTASHRTVQVVPTAGRRSQHTNETNHRRRRSPSRNGH
ncbi:hypothetical protein D915_006091 [Fasciola hepatica]|uniref:Uncharacterized protein n=1 Tax=Fasciola hepatica TaxID=6192 RepID=A0A4E0R5R9_FASHE|nr:hypothetical protein D915_006091 [Fasciola hepatica]